MSYIPGSAAFRFAGEAYLPPAPLVFRFSESATIFPLLPPRLVIGVGSSWASARQDKAREVAALWGDAPEKQHVAAVGWGSAASADAALCAGWAGVPAREQISLAAWGTGHAADGAASSHWNNLTPKDSGTAQGWDSSTRPTDWKVSIAYDPAPPRKDSALATRYQRSNEHGIRVPRDQPPPLHHPGGVVAFTFQGALYTPPDNGNVFYHFYVPAIPPGQIGPVDGTGRIPWGRSQQLDLRSRLPWDRPRRVDPRPTGIEYPDYEGPITIITPPAEPDILETYMIANSVSVVVLPDRVPLEATNLRIGRDIDSFAWTLSANLFGRTSLNQVRPDASGPKEVEVTINGHVWVFLIERYSGTGQMGKEAYGITGVSRTQLLAAPYAPTRSQVNTADINAELAASNELINTGFTLNWDSYTLGPPDWTLPAGAFSYQSQTPMQVIAALAETAGGVVSPALASDELTILPRYREPVWQWSSAVMDRIIPAAIVSDWGSEWQPQPDWNGCYVSGTNYGVSVDVRRAGTAGDTPAPDVFADWITGTEVARSRGIAEICKGGQQEIVTLNLPLFPAETAPGLVTPAQLCEVRDVSETWRGLCLSTEITAEGVGASRVKQSVRLERHHAEGA